MFQIFRLTVRERGEKNGFLEKAIFLAKTGRPGPVWIDLPIDVQGGILAANELKIFEKKEPSSNNVTSGSISKILKMLTISKRPVLLVGNGVRIAGAEKKLLKLVELKAVLNKSKHLAYLAMLADPVINNTKAASSILETMIDFQKEYLGYLK